MCLISETLNEFPFAELVLVEPLGLAAVALELAAAGAALGHGNVAFSSWRRDFSPPVVLGGFSKG